jgi:hypothetical protein
MPSSPQPDTSVHLNNSKKRIPADVLAGSKLRRLRISLENSSIREIGQRRIAALNDVTTPLNFQITQKSYKQFRESGVA